MEVQESRDENNISVNRKFSHARSVFCFNACLVFSLLILMQKQLLQFHAFYFMCTQFVADIVACVKAMIVVVMHC